MKKKSETGARCYLRADGATIVAVKHVAVTAETGESVFAIDAALRVGVAAVVSVDAL